MLKKKLINIMFLFRQLFEELLNDALNEVSFLCCKKILTQNCTDADASEHNIYPLYLYGSK